LRLELTARDQRLFKTINDYGFLSTTQIQKLCFPEIAEATTMRRLRKLRSKQYIQSYTGLPKGQLVWSLAMKARQVINSDFEITVNKNQFEHDILISEIRMRLEKQKVCLSWVSGFRLKQLASKKNISSNSQASQIPDGIFTVQMPSGVHVIALELELASKSKRRYRDIIRNYSQNLKIDWVWYVVRQKSLAEFLCKEANSIETRKRKKWLFSSDLSEILEPDGSVILKNEGHSIILLKPALPNASPQSIQTKT
jgi:hypothetical protein